MVKKGGKKEAKQKKLSEMTNDEKMDYIINVTEKYLEATARMPPGLEKQFAEIYDQYTVVKAMFEAIKDYAQQEGERMQNLETAFTAVVADLQIIKSKLAINNLAPGPTAATHSSKGNPIPNLPIREDLKKMLHYDVVNDTPRITCDFMNDRDDWKTCNKALKQVGWKYYSNKEAKLYYWEQP